MFQETGTKEIGNPIKNTVSVLCSGLLEPMKNISDNGKTINKMDLEFTSGLKKEEKISTLEIGMKATGLTVKDMDLVFSTMQMVPNMKDSGSIT